MSNYTKSTNFATKDTLPSGDANKIVKGTEIDTEYNNIATAIATKADLASPTFTGTVTIPTLSATTGTFSTALAATSGGTGNASYAVGDLLYASTTTALSKLADVATGNALISGGVGVAPSYGKIGLTTHVSGTLPVANGGTGLATITANNVLLGNGTSALQVVAPSTSGNVLQSDGSTWTSTAKLVLSTAQATTSGTSKEFLSIPSWVKRITVMFDAVSSNGTNNLIVQLGATTYTTSGYDSVAIAINGTSVGSTSDTTGFTASLMSAAAGRTVSGSMIITLMGSNTWAYISNTRYEVSALAAGAGRVALSGTLDRLKITTTGGTDAFDAGSVNIMYE
jgi:hypothetical protein